MATITKTNLQHAKVLLQDLIDNEHGEDQTTEKLNEIFDFIETAESEFTDAGYLIDEQSETIKELEKVKDQLQDELDETPSLTSVDLGLDTIHYYLEKGNLNIQQQINSAFNTIQPNAVLY